ncbi:hypothetical protein PAECIP111893_03784 [Paenibacillus plantiphilus]|uniref:Uncharacterized protein n=1 Tax=Paenibacillus plantiphilus TaxID=2905650 RepID=A0ABN8GV04_9BACL|nr:hypothetical protein PAECIP111893_03784 [Paenibacillus plantiphilus]
MRLLLCFAYADRWNARTGREGTVAVLRLAFDTSAAVRLFWRLSINSFTNPMLSNVGFLYIHSKWFVF